MRQAGAILLAAGLAWSAPAGADSPRILYLLHCSGCHGQDGAGSQIGGVPPLPGIVGHFLRDPEGTRYLSNVPGVVNSGLPDAEIAALLNYIVATYGEGSVPAGAKPIEAPEVGRLRNAEVDVVELRRAIRKRLTRQGIDIGDYP